MFKRIYNRIYSDYLMPSRLEEYEKIITEALKKGYTHMSIREAYLILKENKPLPNRLFIHRHDIDTDAKTARLMFQIEKKHNIKSSYYFRQSTLDFDLMKEIEDFGSEASYHFEEIATFAKINHLKNSQTVMSQLFEIQNLFARNLKKIELKLNRKCITVASHGDFANRKLKLNNNLILTDLEFRKSIGIEFECYDDFMMSHIHSRVSDKPYPIYYSPQPILSLIEQNSPSIYFLSHPRQWRTSWKENTIENFTRIFEGLKW